jgi:photosystem II stability/assembly factor-like uncharacterized protein
MKGTPMKMISRLGEFLLMWALTSALLHAQWVQLNGPYGTPVWAVHTSGTTVYAASDYGVSRSTNNGDTWTTVKLPKSIKCFGVQGATVFAGAPGGVYRSADNGMTWTFATNKGINAVTVTAITSLGRYLYAGNMYGVSRSSDNGENWTLVNSGAVTGMAAAGSTLFQAVNGTNGGVFRSNDSGATWTKTSSGINDSDVWSIASGGRTVYAGCGNGEIFRSTDNGASWTAMKTNLSNIVINSIAASGSTIYAGTRGAGIYKTTDSGAHWTKDLRDLTDRTVNGITVAGSTLIAGTYGGAFRSIDDAATWTEINAGLVFRSVNVLAASASGTTILAGCDQGGVYRSSDGGASWHSPNLGLKKSNGPTATAYALATKGALVFAGTDADVGAHKSFDDGITWVGTAAGLPDHYVATYFVTGGTIFAAIFSGGVYRSSDYGVTWTQSDAGLPATSTVFSFAQVGPTLFAAPFANAVYISTNNGGTWTAAKTGFPVGATVRSFAVSSDSTGKTIVFAGTDGYGVYRSTDNGAGWAAFGSGFPQHVRVNALAKAGSTLFAGTEADSMFMSTNNGASWIRANKGLADKTVNALLLVPDAYGNAVLYVATGSSGVYRHSDDFFVRQDLAPTTPPIATVGTPFWVEVRVGDPGPVRGLYGISLKLRSSQKTCTYVSGSAVAGPFLGSAALSFFQSFDKQTVDMAVTKSTLPAVDGTGVVAKAQFVSSEQGPVEFSIIDVQAIDLSGVAIPLNVMGASVRVISSTPNIIPVALPPGEPGKPFTVEVRVGQNVPVTGLYGVSFKLKSNNNACLYVDQSGIAGAFLGSNPVTFFQSPHPTTAEIGVSRTATPGIDGSGVLAKVQFLSTVSGTVRFSVYDVSAIDQFGNSIALDTTSTTVTITSAPSLVPAISGQVSPGTKFWVDARIGDIKAVKGLYGISFKLRSNSKICAYVDGSAVPGSFLGSGQVSFFRLFDAQTVDASTSKSAGSGVDGSGVLMRAQFISATTGTVSFSFQDVIAIDSNGATIPLAAGDLVLRVEVGSTTDVADVKGIPGEFALLQNYPNPFNPSTVIQFALPRRCNVHLAVYDQLGKEVATLVSRELGAGYFSVRWNANVPSGIYFFRLVAGDASTNSPQSSSAQGFVDTKKMIFLK